MDQDRLNNCDYPSKQNSRISAYPEKSFYRIIRLKSIKPLLLKILAIGIIISIPFFNFAETKQEVTVNIVFPLAGAEVNPQNGYCYILGQTIPNDATLFINGDQVKLEDDGSFVHYTKLKFEDRNLILQLNDTTKLPVNAYFDFEVDHKGTREIFQHYVYAKRQTVTSPADKLEFDPTFPSSIDANLKLLPGEVLNVSIKGTPNCQAYFTIEGIKEKFPMIEIFRTGDFYTGEAVFGSGFKTYEDTIRGIYEGHIILPKENWKDKVVTVHLINKELGIIKKELNGRVTVNTSLQHDVIEVIDDPNLVVGRTKPGLGYKIFFQGGVKVISDGEYDDWIRLRLAKDEVVFVSRSSVKILPKGTLPPTSTVEVIRTKNDSDYVRIEIGLKEKLPVEIRQLSNPQKLVLRIFNASSDIDWIFYDRTQNLVDKIFWSQPKDDVLELEIDLNQKQQWGYTAFYEGNILVLRIKKTPKIEKKWLFFGNPLEGRRIVLDPGHNPEFGSVGPRGTKEKDVNLQITLKVKEILENAGAKVFLTHIEDPLPLRERKKKVLSFNPNVSISIHNNALPEGVDPNQHHGSSVYFYNSNAQMLAKIIHSNLLKKLQLRDFGFYWDNLYMCRIPETIAILIEPAFMIIPPQEKLLVDENFQYKIAEAIKEGLEYFFEKVSE